MHLCAAYATHPPEQAFLGDSSTSQDAYGQRSDVRGHSGPECQVLSASVSEFREQGSGGSGDSGES